MDGARSFLLPPFRDADSRSLSTSRCASAGILDKHRRPSNLTFGSWNSIRSFLSLGVVCAVFCSSCDFWHTTIAYVFAFGSIQWIRSLICGHLWSPKVRETKASRTAPLRSISTPHHRLPAPASTPWKAPVSLSFDVWILEQYPLVDPVMLLLFQKSTLAASGCIVLCRILLFLPTFWRTTMPTSWRLDSLSNLCAVLFVVHQSRRNSTKLAMFWIGLPRSATAHEFVLFN